MIIIFGIFFPIIFFRSPHFVCLHFETPHIETPHFVSNNSAPPSIFDVCTPKGQVHKYNFLLVLFVLNIYYLLLLMILYLCNFFNLYMYIFKFLHTCVPRIATKSYKCRDHMEKNGRVLRFWEVSRERILRQGMRLSREDCLICSRT